MATPIEINQLIEQLSQHYGYQLPYSARFIYVDVLKDIPVEALARAVRRHIQESPSFPQVDDLRKISGRTLRG
jgi:hypothetical protein